MAATEPAVQLCSFARGLAGGSDGDDKVIKDGGMDAAEVTMAAAASDGGAALSAPFPCLPPLP